VDPKLKSPILQKLLEAFHEAQEGTFISGEKLARIANCSRTAIWKHIEELKKEGFQIEAVRNKGYRLLDSPEWSESRFYLGLNTKVIGKKIFFYDSISSTQTIAKELALKGEQEGTIVIADEQVSGRGRMARNWHSLKGAGLWMSMIIRPNIPIVKAPQITLLTAVSYLLAIKKETNLNIGIKWPNDLLVNQKKVCGILTELQAEENRVQSIIIGIGVNVNQSIEDFPPELRNIATSLSIEKGEKIDRMRLLQTICSEFENLYELYLKKGFPPIKELWEEHALSIGKDITAHTISGSYRGIATGINEDGVLLLQLSNGTIQPIYSADIEL